MPASKDAQVMVTNDSWLCFIRGDHLYFANRFLLLQALQRMLHRTHTVDMGLLPTLESLVSTGDALEDTRILQVSLSMLI